jgi:hypothetical protein
MTTYETNENNNLKGHEPRTLRDISQTMFQTGNLYYRYFVYFPFDA